MTLDRRTPLRRDGERARAFSTRRSRIERRTELRASAWPTRPRSRTRAKAKQNDWPPGVRAAARTRSGGRCELRLETCDGPAVELHHRKLRRHGDHSLANALDLCLSCHAWVHAHPERSYLRGYLLKGYQDPASIPVLRAAS